MFREGMERTRATFHDVIRATEVHRYTAVIVENVPDVVTEWELFDWWVEGMVRLTKAEALAMEPQLACEGALLSPESGVFDSHGYMLALQGEIEACGGAVVLNTPFEGASPLAEGGFQLRAGGAEPVELACRLLVTAPGLSAQAVAGAIEGFPAGQIPKAHFGKGM